MPPVRVPSFADARLALVKALARGRNSLDLKMVSGIAPQLSATKACPRWWRAGAAGARTPPLAPARLDQHRRRRYRRGCRSPRRRRDAGVAPEQQASPSRCATSSRAAGGSPSALVEAAAHDVEQRLGARFSREQAPSRIAFAPPSRCRARPVTSTTGSSGSKGGDGALQRQPVHVRHAHVRDHDAVELRRQPRQRRGGRRERFWR